MRRPQIQKIEKLLPLIAVIVIAAYCMGVHLVANVSLDGVSIFRLSNLVGPAAHSLVSRGDMAVDLKSMGYEGTEIIARCARMPVAPALIALFYKLSGIENLYDLAFIKIALLLAPVFFVLKIVSENTHPKNRISSWALLLIPFFSTAVLSNAVSMQVEEGYAYSLIALAFTLMLVRYRRASSLNLQAIALSFVLSTIFLTKSSYLPFCLLMAAAYAWPRSGTIARFTPLFTVCLICVSWGSYQKYECGEFHLGTSLDGINLHKGNNPKFLMRYPPPPGSNLDAFDSELQHGLTFSSEWAFDSYHKEQAINYIKENQVDTIKGFVLKFSQFFFAIEKIGSSQSAGLRLWWELISLSVFRVFNTAALTLAIVLCAGNGTNKTERYAATIYILLCLSISLPYLIGFSYTRHASVLFMPTTIFLCHTLNHAIKARYFIVTKINNIFS
jgi:hypothetical protein